MITFYDIADFWWDRFSRNHKKDISKVSEPLPFMMILDSICDVERHCRRFICVLVGCKIKTYCGDYYEPEEEWCIRCNAYWCETFVKGRWGGDLIYKDECLLRRKEL